MIMTLSIIIYYSECLSGAGWTTETSASKLFGNWQLI